MRDFSKLSQWIQPQHLEVSAIEFLKEVFLSQSSMGIVLDNFFQEDIVGKVQKVIAEEAIFNTRYELFSDNGHVRVSEEAFFNAPEKSHFYCRNVIENIEHGVEQAVKQEYRMSPNWITYLKFLNVYKNLLPNFFGEITGCPLFLQRSLTFSHRQEHYLRKHSDVGENRRLCSILYLSSDWSAECGGALHMCGNNGAENIIQALCNRLVIFTPTPQAVHYVARHTDLAKDKTRDCHVAWYKDR